MPKEDATTGPATEATATLEARVAEVINLIRPAVQADGGDVEFLGLTDDDRVRVRFHGACVGCPSSTMTLQGGIARALKDRIPEVNGVELVES